MRSIIIRQEEPQILLKSTLEGEGRNRNLNTESETSLNTANAKYRQASASDVF